jgi:hypothetical protein
MLYHLSHTPSPSSFSSLSLFLSQGLPNFCLSWPQTKIFLSAPLEELGLQVCDIMPSPIIDAFCLFVLFQTGSHRAAQTHYPLASASSLLGLQLCPIMPGMNTAVFPSRQFFLVIKC